MWQSLVKKIDGAVTSPKVVKTITLLAILCSYIRIFLATEVTDEVYHIAGASLTALGGTFFENDSYFAQVSSIIYEPIIYVYHWLTGNFGVVLFVRHLYFLLALACFYSFYRLLRKMISPDLALMISAIPVVFIPYAVPSVGYNTIGAFCLGIGCALTLNAALTNRLMLALLGGWAFAISAYVYPSFVLAPAILYFALGFHLWQKDHRFPKVLSLGAVFSGFMFFAIWGVTVLRFDFDKVQHSIETTQAYGSGSAQGLAAKWEYFESMIGYVTPPGWVLVVIVLVLAALVVMRMAWTWAIALAAVLFILMVQQPTFTAPSNLFVSFCFLLGLASLFPLRLKSHDNLDRISLVMILLGCVLCVSTYFTSANQGLATPLATQFGLIFVFARSAAHFRRAAIVVPMIAFFSTITFFNYTHAYREGNIADFNTLITTGPYAGIWTGESKANLLKQIEDDIHEASQGATSILFYDNFPAGYLFSDLRPATRSLFIHPLPNGIWDRELYTEYYKNPANRPDVFFQFEGFPYAPNSIMLYRTEQWTKPPMDTFFDYLPNTGDYERLHQRFFYSVWRKKSLAPKN